MTQGIRLRWKHTLPQDQCWPQWPTWCCCRVLMKHLCWNEEEGPHMAWHYGQRGCCAASACHAPGTVVENSGGMLFSQISVSSARPSDHMCLPQYVMLIPSVTLVCCHSPWQYPWLPSLLLPGLVADAISPQHSNISHKHGLRWTGIQFARAWLGLRVRGYEVI